MKQQELASTRPEPKKIESITTIDEPKPKTINESREIKITIPIRTFNTMTRTLLEEIKKDREANDKEVERIKKQILY